jgi:hypothetical protein
MVCFRRKEVWRKENNKVYKKHITRGNNEKKMIAHVNELL